MPNRPATKSLLGAQIDQAKANTPKDRLKLRDISVTDAVIYPVLRRNWVNVLLLPILPGVLATALSMLGLWLWNTIWPTPDTTGLFQTPASGYFCALAALLSFCSLTGYGWRLLHNLRTSGYNAPAPDWTLEMTLWSWWDGLKLTLVIILTVFMFVLPGYLIDRSYEQAVESVSDREIQRELEQLRKTPEFKISHANDSKTMEPGSTLTVSDFNDILGGTEEERAVRSAHQPKYSVCARLASLTLCFLLMPFFLAGVVQSRESRGLQRFNIRRILSAGRRCYGKSLLVSVFALLLFALSIAALCFLNSKAEGALTASQFVYSLLTLAATMVLPTAVTAHLVAQAFDSCEGGGTTKQDAGSKQSQAVTQTVENQE